MIKIVTYACFLLYLILRNRYSYVFLFQNIIDFFNSRNTDLRILLLSFTASGIGLNLVGGNHLLLFDIHGIHSWRHKHKIGFITLFREKRLYL